MQFSSLALFCYQTVKRNLQDLKQSPGRTLLLDWSAVSTAPDCSSAFEGSWHGAEHCSCCLSKLVHCYESYGIAVMGRRWRTADELERVFLTFSDPNLTLCSSNLLIADNNTILKILLQISCTSVSQID